ncbi:Gas vesicle protein GvpA [Candidatus Magnetomorum sp. HK-1]|nr:Gas vesicle protein GvpA [Candidatus Magnetomorum sp. HK-1]
MDDEYSKDNDSIVLCEVLDRLLNKGAVIAADVTISVANVDLIYLKLMAVLTSVETGKKLFRE